MFAYNRTSPLAIFDALGALHSLQQQQYQEQLAAQRPKIIKKVESEDKYQIQIFKQNGNFHSYEVKVLRSIGNRNLVNLVIESDVDDFRKVFQFRLDDIDVPSINWDYFKHENVLVLNVPKKVKYCSDDFANSVLSALVGAPYHQNEKRCKRAEQKKVEKKRERKPSREEQRLEELRKEEQRITSLRKEAERQLREQAEREAQEAQQAQREADRAAKVAAEKERRRAAVRARKEQEERARREEEERARREQEQARREQEQARREQEEAARQQSAEEHRRKVQESQEYLARVFGGAFFPQSVFPVHVVAQEKPEPELPSQHETAPSQPQSAPSQPQSAPSQPAQASSQSSAELPSAPSQTQSEPDAAEDDSDADSYVVMSDSESIHSEDNHSDTSSPLKRQPSLEEVEDEEFVVFRKKFSPQS